MTNQRESEKVTDPGSGKIASLIFDLDGVITQTRKTHQKAWRRLFDFYFDHLDPDRIDQPAMSENDYRDYVDGKPRYEGVKSFLLSRGIDLPYGEPEDEPGTRTICALGNKKNDFFNKIIDEEGVDVYADAISKIEAWRKQGYKTAIVSSSENCKMIIEKAGIAGLFDERVDGEVSAELGLKGKPDPDIFVEAARRLKAPVCDSVVFEDAISGVQAGQRGYFGLVVGVNRFDSGDVLMDQGADIIIDNFSQIDLNDDAIIKEYFSRQGEPVLPDNPKLFDKLKGRRPVIFLDYDGTLTPIVKRPEDAVLSDEMRKTLEELAEEFKVAVVTGRDKEDVESLVGIEKLIYAGSHGYIITGPDEMLMEHPDSKKIIPKLDQIEKEVVQALKDTTEGTQVDRKRYAIGIHYRNARKEDRDVVFRVVDDMLRKHPGHKKGEGKMIVEIKPDTDWHKGKAVEWILEALDLADNEDVMPLYIGDDITDEDAFETLIDKGIGILVGGHGQPTAAPFALKNVFQVRQFFEKLLVMYP